MDSDSIALGSIDRAFNPTRDYNHADDNEYRRLRGLAEQEYKTKQRYSQESQAAYKRGDKSEASRLSNIAHEHLNKMDEYNNQAAMFVFRANNADSDYDEIDLHGLYLKEAQEYLSLRMNAAIQRGDKHLEVIVGKGLHSQNGIAKLRPMVEDMCRQHNFRYAVEQNNTGVIIVDFTRPGGQVGLDEIAAKPRPDFNYNNYPQQQQQQYPQQQPQQQQQYAGGGGNDNLNKLGIMAVQKLVKGCCTIM